MWWIRIAYGQFRPQLAKWLVSNAFNFNATDTAKIAAILGVTTDKFKAGESAIAAGVLNVLDALVAGK